MATLDWCIYSRYVPYRCTDRALSGRPTNAIQRCARTIYEILNRSADINFVSFKCLVLTNKQPTKPDDKNEAGRRSWQALHWVIVAINNDCAKGLHEPSTSKSRASGDLHSAMSGSKYFLLDFFEITTVIDAARRVRKYPF